MDDTFTLYDLKVEVVAGDRPFVCSHRVGDYFLVEGENLHNVVKQVRIIAVEEEALLGEIVED